MIKLFCDGCGKEIKVGTKADYLFRSDGELDYCDDCKGKRDQLMKWLDIYDSDQLLVRKKLYEEKKRELFGY